LHAAANAAPNDRESTMSEISERYRRLSNAFAAKIAAVSPDGWEQRSPCEGWTARDVVGHVVATQGMFLGFVGREMGDIPSADDDPAAAWDAARSVMQRELDDPQRATAEFEGFQGPTTLEAAVNRFLCFDLVVHGWDLARATGQDDRIAAEDVTRVREQAEALADRLRGPQAFGPEVDPPPGADDQARLLAYLGRQP
jgi:uncharacterized protein (TIGR03086 family)